MRLKIPHYARVSRFTMYSFMILHARTYLPTRQLYKLAQIMRNKPNLLKAKMNVTSVKTSYYENSRLRGHCKTNPNKANFKANIKAKTPLLTKTNPIQSQNKPNQTQSHRPRFHLKKQ